VYKRQMLHLGLLLLRFVILERNLNTIFVSQKKSNIETILSMNHLKK
jgi:hypothetical protein